MYGNYDTITGERGDIMKYSEILKNPEIIEYYDETLKGKPKDHKIKWTNKVLNDLKENCDIENDKFVICATDGVWEYLTNEDVMNIVKESYINGDKADNACDLLIKSATNIWKKENSTTVDDISCAILFLNIK